RSTSFHPGKILDPVNTVGISAFAKWNLIVPVLAVLIHCVSKGSSQFRCEFVIYVGITEYTISGKCIFDFVGEEPWIIVIRNLFLLNISLSFYPIISQIHNVHVGGQTVSPFEGVGSPVVRWNAVGIGTSHINVGAKRQFRINFVGTTYVQ